jgi:hypothetical protein
LILRYRSFQCAIVAPFETFDSSLTGFEMSRRECVTKYNRIPNPDLNFVCWSGDSKVSSLPERLKMVRGGAGVSKSFNDSTSAPNYSLRLLRSFSWWIWNVFFALGSMILQPTKDYNIPKSSTTMCFANSVRILLTSVGREKNPPSST